MTTKIRLTPDKVGRYEVVCTELCGLGHSTMRNAVRVVPAAAFDSWVKKQKGGPAAGPGAPSGPKKPDGKQVFMSSGCGSCHTLRDAGSSGTVGPKLDTLARDAAKFGKQRGETPQQYVKESIVKPTAFTVPGFPKGVMPSNFGSQLSAEQLDALVGYLLRVSGGTGK
jgi:cytochrome c oxidase subunit 2